MARLLSDLGVEGVGVGVEETLLRGERRGLLLRASSLFGVPGQLLLLKRWTMIFRYLSKV